MNATPVGIDIAKNVFQVHYVDAQTGEIVNRSIKRAQFLEHFANRAPCLIGMEACPPRQNTCRPDRIHEPGAMMRKRIGKIRTGIQGQSGGAVAAAGERGVGRRCA
jgi:hypothetical protein